MSDLYKLIPHAAGRTLTFKQHRKPSPIPSADRSVIVGPAWFCLPELGYCGATDHGIRCTRCSSQVAGHDFGDEDPRQP